MKSLLSTFRRQSGNPRPPAAPPAGHADGSLDAIGLRDAILEHGLDADRARALANALEADGQLLEAVEALLEANRLRRDVTVERQLVRLRRDAFAHIDRSLPPPAWPPFVPEDRPGATEGGPPAVTAAELTPAVLRNGILRHGSLWVKGLVPPRRAAVLRDAIDRTMEAQEAFAAGTTTPAMAAWCDPLDGIPDGDARRYMIRAGQGVLTVDSPRATYEFLATVRDLGVDRLIAAYLGERPVLSAEKCTLRRLDPSDPKLGLANWHQDGSFLGAGIRTVNAWFALSPCGRDAPGMDIIPIRVERLLATGEDGATYGWTVSPETIARELPGVPIWRPEFEAGDALFFDHFCLHRTAAEPGMSRLRYGIESWFFAPSVYPEGSTALVV
jgi:hypothetical protein